jgi:hypothetical protein
MVSDGTSIDETEKAEGSCERPHADRPASSIRFTRACRSMGGVTEGRSIAPRSDLPPCRAGTCERPPGRSAYDESCDSGGNGKSGNRPLGRPVGNRRRTATPQAAAYQGTERVPGSSPQSPVKPVIPRDFAMTRQRFAYCALRADSAPPTHTRHPRA